MTVLGTLLAAAAVAIGHIDPADVPQQGQHGDMAAKKRRERHRRLIRRYEPYRGCTTYGGCSTYPIPASVVECESHGELRENSHPYSSSGQDQIELSTWRAYGGLAFASFPYLASKLQQAIVATRILRAQGRGAWTCAYLVGWA